MNVETLYPIVQTWHDTGVLSDADKPEVLEAYKEITGLTFTGTCKKCQWSDVQHALRYYLIKVLNLTPMSSTSKYIIKPGLAYLAIHGLAFVYINKGQAQESDSAKYLTDSVAEKLLEREGMDEVIIPNPDYKESDEGGEGEENLTPQQKAARTKAANKAKADAEAAEAKAKADADEAAKAESNSGTSNE